MNHQSPQNHITITNHQNHITITSHLKSHLENRLKILIYLHDLLVLQETHIGMTLYLLWSISLSILSAVRLL